MKNVFNVFIFALLVVSVQAQVEVREGTKAMKEGSFNAYTVVLDGIQENQAEDGWKDIIKEYKGKVKKDKKARLLISDNVQIPSISANPVDIYTMIIEGKGDMSTTVSIWFDTGSGYVNSIDMPAQTDIASGIVKEYATKVMRKNAEEVQKKEEDYLKDLNKDAKNLENKNKDLREDIAKAKANILKWEKELEQNEDDISKKQKVIEKQEEVVNEAKKTTRKY